MFRKIVIGGLSFLGAVFIVCAVFVIYIIANVDYKYTGEQLFNAVNKHRVSVSAPILELDPILCDNLVERWFAIKNPNVGHKGYEEWLKSQGIADNPKYGVIGEMYIRNISTPENAIAWWLGSPGHKSTLERKDLIFGCAYASDGSGVVIMASKK